MTRPRLDASMMERAIAAANARTSPAIILPDGKDVPLILYAMRQLIEDVMDAQTQAMGFRNAICEHAKIDPKKHFFTWEENPNDQPKSD